MKNNAIRINASDMCKLFLSLLTDETLIISLLLKCIKTSDYCTTKEYVSLFQYAEDQEVPSQDVPAIEPIENALVREVWSTPRPTDSIQMDNERAQEVDIFVFVTSFVF